MARTTYRPLIVKRALNRVHGMPFEWSLNPYRGCVHACHYCYARETHTYLGLDVHRDFEREIFVKRDLPRLLEQEISRPGWVRSSIAIGTATDPYQPAEKRFRVTRRCLEVLERYRNPFSIVTKSPLVNRDLDHLQRAARTIDVRVYVTVTTVDRVISDRLEPGAFPPEARLDAVQRLAEAGVPVGVMMAPVMPGINDSAESIEALAAAAAAHGAKSFWAGPLRLAPPVRDHFFATLEREFPDVLPWYLRHLEGQHLPRDVRARIEAVSAEAQERYGLPDSARRTPVEPEPVRPSPIEQLVFPGFDSGAPTVSMLRYDHPNAMVE